ncbi:hypothetical protein ACFX2I_023316 [Malus domestica]
MAGIEELTKKLTLCPIAKRASPPAALPWSSTLAIPTHYRTGVYNINELGLQKCTTLAVDDSADGASSVVHRAIHIPTYRILALKKINIFEKEKRQQLLTEILTLRTTLLLRPCRISWRILYTGFWSNKHSFRVYRWRIIGGY